ncbi:MAG: hypothetical protein KGJ86_07015, partial [Chloroflexota bacterium]|nr:hypothetical protein [Chloroflexota bacterium]
MGEGEGTSGQAVSTRSLTQGALTSILSHRSGRGSIDNVIERAGTNELAALARTAREPTSQGRDASYGGVAG